MSATYVLDSWLCSLFELQKASDISCLPLLGERFECVWVRGCTYSQPTISLEMRFHSVFWIIWFVTACFGIFRFAERWFRNLRLWKSLRDGFNESKGAELTCTKPARYVPSLFCKLCFDIVQIPLFAGNPFSFNGKLVFDVMGVWGWKYFRLRSIFSL